MDVMNTIWNLLQQRQIRDVTKDAFDAKSSIRLTDSDNRSLKERVDGLTLITQAMWELLSTLHALSEQDLISKIEEVDLRDGRWTVELIVGKTAQYVIVRLIREEKIVYTVGPPFQL